MTGPNADKKELEDLLDNLNIDEDSPITPSKELEAELKNVKGFRRMATKTEVKAAMAEVFEDVGDVPLTRKIFSDRLRRAVRHQTVPGQILKHTEPVANQVIQMLMDAQNDPSTSSDISDNLMWCIEKIRDRDLYKSANTIQMMDKIKGPAAREMDGFVKAYSELPTLQRIRSDNKAASVMKQQRRSSQPFIPQLESLRSIVIANINDTDFDIWEVEEVHGKVKGLEIIAGNIFKHWSFPINLGIDLDLMMAAVEKIGLGYVNENTYHNALHAGDVLHQTHMLTLKTNVVQIAAVEPIHHFSALFAAVIHDYKHPGFNNGYLVNTKDPIAIRYNDKAVLENFHAAEAFQDLTDPSVDIFQRMTPEEYRTARNIIVECVLATDMSRHFNELAIAPIKFATPVEERTFLLSIMLHASDISNPTRPFNTYSKWADAAISEFFSQGDRERDLGLPVSMLCDRNTVTLPKSQIGFINGIVLPMYLVIEQQFPELGYMVDQIRDNLAEWEERAKEVQYS